MFLFSRLYIMEQRLTVHLLLLKYRIFSVKGGNKITDYSPLFKMRVPYNLSWGRSDKLLMFPLKTVEEESKGNCRLVSSGWATIRGPIWSAVKLNESFIA